MLPFRGEAVMVMYDQIQEAPLQFPSDVPASPALKRLLLAMLTKDPGKRLTLPQLLADPWLNPCGGLQARPVHTLHGCALLLRMHPWGGPSSCRLHPFFRGKF